MKHSIFGVKVPINDDFCHLIVQYKYIGWQPHIYAYIGQQVFKDKGVVVERDDFGIGGGGERERSIGRGDVGPTGYRY